jgi:acetyl-CoA carboxylase biotin carboxyl carrier protein
MSYETLRDLVELLNGSEGVTELSISGPSGSELRIKRSAARFPALTSNSTALATRPASDQSGFSESEPEEALDGGSKIPAAAIFANRVGVFHSAKKPLQVGDDLQVGQIIGYIESIKLMNEIRSDITGEVADLLVEDGMPVEYGQPLLHVAPAES